MSAQHGNEHWKSVAELLSSLSIFGQASRRLFFVGRAAMIWAEALEANRRIDEGAVSGKLEDSGLGTLEDLERLGMLGAPGFRLGSFEGHSVNLPQDWHVAIMGMAGAGKTTSLSAPNIIRLLKGDEAGEGRESVVGLEWKNGELVDMTAVGLEAVTGVPPHVLAPYDPTNDTAINPFQDLIDRAAMGQSVVDDARARVHGFHAEALANAGQNRWIELTGAWKSEFVVVGKAHLDPEGLTPGSMWDFAHAPVEKINAFMEVAAEHTEIEGGYLAANARAFLARYGEDNQRELRWALQSVGQAFQLFPPGSALRRATDRTTVDVASFKAFPQALFINIPDRYLMSAAPYVSSVLQYIIETVAGASGPHRVAILAEEFAALPFNETLLKAIRTYRALGVRMITVVQDRSGYAKYRQHGGHKPFEENSVKLYFGISDPDHLQHLERRAGKRAVLIETRSTSLGVNVPGRSRGGNEQLTPVLPASEIARIGHGKALLDIPGQPLFVLDRTPGWEQPDIAPFLRNTRFDA